MAKAMVRKCLRLPRDYALAMAFYARHLGVSESVVATLALDMLYLNDKTYKYYVEVARRWYESNRSKSEGAG